MASEPFLTAFATDLIELELGPLPGGLEERAAGWVATRMAGAGDVARLGLGIASRVIGTAVRLRFGRGYGALPPDRRRKVAARLAASRLPVVAEYVRAVRALAVTYVYDARHATAP